MIVRIGDLFNYSAKKLFVNHRLHRLSQMGILFSGLRIIDRLEFFSLMN